MKFAFCAMHSKVKDFLETTKNKLVDNKKYLKCNATGNKKNKNVNFHVFPGVKFLTCRVCKESSPPSMATRSVKDNFYGYCKLNKSSMKILPIT